MTDKKAFHEALYVLSLDNERFDVVRNLLDVGYSPRPNLATWDDLDDEGKIVYRDLDRLFRLTADKKPPLTVVRRPRACHDVATEHAGAKIWPHNSVKNDPKTANLTTEPPSPFGASYKTFLWGSR